MPATQTSVDSRGVRARLVEAVRLDLVGPWAGHELEIRAVQRRAAADDVGEDRASQLHWRQSIECTEKAAEHTLVDV